MTAVNNNPNRIGSATRETSAVLIKLVKLPEVPDAQKVVVKRDDTLWDIAAARLGAGANSAQVARYVEVIKKMNPNISSPLRDGGNRLYPGDEIKMPPTNWSAAKPKGFTGDHTQAAAAARAQNDLNKDLAAQKELQEKTTLKTNLEAAVSFANDPEVLKNGLNPGQKNLVNALLGKAERIAPELLKLPAIQELKTKAWLPDPSEASAEVGY